MGAAHEALVHLVHDEDRLTFGDVRRRSLSLARELQSSFGVRPGDRVAIAMRNLPEFVVSFWARRSTAHRRAVEFVVDGPRAELRAADAGAVVAFLDDERLERVVADGRPPGVRAHRRANRWCRPCGRAVRRVGRRRTAGRRPRSRSSIPTTRSRSSTRRARPAGPRVRSARTGMRSPTSGTWRSSPVGVAHRRTPTRPGPPDGHAGGAAAVPHRRGGVDHREPDRRHEARADAQVGRRRRHAPRHAGARHRLRRRAADRRPDPRARGAGTPRSRHPDLPDGWRRGAARSAAARARGAR